MNLNLKTILTVMVTLVSISILLISCEEDYPSPLIKNINNWEKVDINPTQLFEEVKKQAGGTINIELQVENHPDWTFEMKEYQLATDDAREVMITENGEVDLPIPESYFLYGTNISGKKVLMAIYENEFSMRILENGIESIIEPLSNHSSTAKQNEYLFYSGRDVMNTEEVVCGNRENHEKRTSVERANSAKKINHYIKTSSLGDWTFYQLEKGNSWQLIRDNHFYGGARFWFYNDNDTEVKYQYIGVYNFDGVTIASSTGDIEKYRKEFRDFGNANSWFPLNDAHIFYHNVYVEGKAGKSKFNVLCQNQSNAYMWIRHTTDRQTNLNKRDNLFAHEIAHMLDMQHVDGTGLMSRSVGAAIAQWSSNAQSNLFDKYLDDHGNCTSDN